MLTKEQGIQEMKLLRAYLQEQRKLEIDDSCAVMVNTLEWFGVDIRIIVEIFERLKAQKIACEVTCN